MIQEDRMRKRKKIKRNRFIVIVVSILLGAGVVFFMHCQNNHRKYEDLRGKICSSMNNKDIRTKAFTNAVKLNNGSSTNTCVYFLSEVLRANGFKVDEKICNTTELLAIMKKDGWKRESDYKKLKPGDICFTTDEKLNEEGTPTHVYIFMGWKIPGNYDYAYICDNQAKDYGGKIYHLRNIAKIEKQKNNTKEPFSFFIYK